MYQRCCYHLSINFSKSYQKLYEIIRDFLSNPTYRQTDRQTKIPNKKGHHNNNNNYNYYTGEIQIREEIYFSLPSHPLALCTYLSLKFQPGVWESVV